MLACSAACLPDVSGTEGGRTGRQRAKHSSALLVRSTSIRILRWTSEAVRLLVASHFSLLRRHRLRHSADRGDQTSRRSKHGQHDVPRYIRVRPRRRFWGSVHQALASQCDIVDSVCHVMCARKSPRCRKPLSPFRCEARAAAVIIMRYPAQHMMNQNSHRTVLKVHS